MFAIFCFVYIENSRDLQEKEVALTQSRLDALQLQMNPHFIANALNALSMLVDTDPEAAKRMKMQIANAREWRDVVNTFFHRLSGIDDEKGRKIYD